MEWLGITLLYLAVFFLGVIVGGTTIIGALRAKQGD